MQLPSALRQAIDQELTGITLADLAAASALLSQRYRAETRDGRFHLNDELAARAYLTTRMPATYSAISASFAAIIEAAPDFQPKSVLDVGAGPGTATWAASSIWDSITDGTLIEASTAIRMVGERLSKALPLDRVTWLAQRIGDGLRDAPSADLVVLAYVLDELDRAARTPLIARLWELTAHTMVIIEPGTTEGWKRILAARDQLIAGGAHILAPCPHAETCPLLAPDWCHFSARTARSRLHREAKGGSVPWEDEKFIYLGVSRHPAISHAPRVLAPPHVSKAGVSLKLCQPDGSAAARTVAKRDGAAFKAAKKLDWGDAAPIRSSPPTEQQH
jgi:ribosomal protein RSM22 (predicted rRNA methylase)